MGMTLFELKQRMTTQELNQWWQYYLIEPFGYPQEHMLSAKLQATIMNFSGQVNKMVNPMDLLPDRLNQNAGKQELDSDSQVVGWLEL